MKITSVEPQKKNPKRFNIFLDGEFAFGADEDLVVDNRLVIGKEISSQDLEKLLQEAEVGKLMERMYRLFNIRARSEKEIRDYLKNLSFKRKIKDQEELSSFIVDAAVQLMKRKSLINDEDFTKAWVESRSKKYGINRIKQELYKKGIDKEIIEEVVRLQRAHEGEGYSEEIAKKQLEKRIERWKNLKPMEFRKKAYEFLLRKGFEYDLIKRIVDTSIKLSVNPELKSKD